MLTVRLETEVQIRNERLTRLALGVLREKPSHGYELMKQLEEFGLHPGEISAGILYQTLRQLETEDLCNSEWEVPSEGDSSACLMYSVTDQLLTPEKITGGFWLTALFGDATTGPGASGKNNVQGEVLP